MGRVSILVVRHGQAVDEAPGLGDSGRFLTGKGRKVTRKVAKWLAEKAERCPTEIWTSPLVRAVQTAEILAEYAHLTDSVRVAAELSPASDPRSVIARLAERRVEGTLALVGHEPGLSMLATGLLGDVGWPGFKKSGVLGADYGGSDKATFRFLLDPKELEVVTDLGSLR